MTTMRDDSAKQRGMQRVPGGLLILVLSFVPMLLYALVLWWLDRYEKEPFGLPTVSFLWGAVPSIVLALIMQIALDVP